MQARQNDTTIATQIVPLLPAIYEAATQPACWPDAFAQVVRVLDGNAGLMFSHDATLARWFSPMAGRRCF